MLTRLRDRFRRWLLGSQALAALEAATAVPALTAAPGPRKVKALKISAAALGLSHGKVREAQAFSLPEPAPGVLPAGVKGMAADEAVSSAYAYAMSGIWGEGLQFMGYPYLAELTQRPEYRRISETIAKEMTRKWIKLVVTGDDEDGTKGEKLKKLEAALVKFKVQDVFRNALEQDGFFGRSHIYIDTGAGNDAAELAVPLIVDKAKIPVGGLKRLQVIEPMWVYPDQYNSTDPMRPDYYKPTTWFVMAKRVNSSRLLRIVSREVPDILKPAYQFGGLSMSQMAKPYVDNWLRTRQSVSDLIHSFAVPVIKTVLGDVLQGGAGQPMLDRVQLFNQLRDNRGAMVIDKETEDFDTVSTPLSELPLLQAQSQEHMAAVAGIPLTILLGITPSGLNASSEGEIRTYYGWVEALQEDVVREPLKRVIDIVQLSEFGEIDPEVGFQFVPLWTMSKKEEADIGKVEADTAQVYVDAGVISPEEQREVLAATEGSPYAGIDLSVVPDVPGEEDTEVDTGEKPGETDAENPEQLDDEQGGP